MNLKSKCGVLTPRQALENVIKNDERNIESFRKYSYSQDTVARIIADCAKHLFEAKEIDKELERLAEYNLKNALDFWWI